MYQVLLLCENNSVLSPMALAYFLKYAGKNSEVFCAGISKKKIDPLVLTVLEEDGLKLPPNSQHELSELNHIDFDYILTLDKESEEESHHLPSHPVKYHYDFIIPAKRDLALKEQAFRKLRDSIASAMQNFIDEHINNNDSD